MMIRGCSLATVMIMATLMMSIGSLAQADTGSDSSNCSIKQAAQTALQRRIALIDAAKVNPNEFFSGSNSCINTSLLSSFDLSKFVPDLANFLSSSVTEVGKQALNMAKQQVCQVLNQQLNQVVNNINSTLSGFSSQLGSELSGLMGGGSINLPNTSGIGQYKFSPPNNYGDIFSMFNGNSSPTTVNANTVFEAPSSNWVQ